MALAWKAGWAQALVGSTPTLSAIFIFSTYMLDTVVEIKKRLDLVEIIGEHVPLKPAGANMKGLCPFHQERTPSFMVHKDRQTWHCFGCGEGGDLFTFVQK